MWFNKKVKEYTYQRTVYPFSEEDLAIIIQNHPKELMNIYNALAADSWKKVDKFLESKLDGSDKYAEFKQLLKKNKVEVKQHLKDLRKETKSI